MYEIDIDRIFYKTLFMILIKTELILIIKSTPQFEPSQGQFHVLVSATKTRAMQRYIQCMYVR